MAGIPNSKTAPKSNAFLTLIPTVLFQVCLRGPEILERVTISTLLGRAKVRLTCDVSYRPMAVFSRTRVREFGRGETLCECWGVGSGAGPSPD